MGNGDPQVQINQSIARGTIDLAPATVHEVITRRMVEELTAAVAELRSRVNALIFTVIAAVVVQVVLKVGGL